MRRSTWGFSPGHCILEKKRYPTKMESVVVAKEIHLNELKHKSSNTIWKWVYEYPTKIHMKESS
jgi:hypothetical protein